MKSGFNKIPMDRGNVPIRVPWYSSFFLLHNRMENGFIDIAKDEQNISIRDPWSSYFFYTTGWRVVLLKSKKKSKIFQYVIYDLHHFFILTFAFREDPIIRGLGITSPSLFMRTTVFFRHLLCFVFFLSFWFLASRSRTSSLQFSPQSPSLNTPLPKRPVWTKILWKQILFSLARVVITRSWCCGQQQSKHSANINNPNVYHLTAHFHCWSLHLRHWKPAVQKDIACIKSLELTKKIVPRWLLESSPFPGNEVEWTHGNISHGVEATSSFAPIYRYCTSMKLLSYSYYQSTRRSGDVLCRLTWGK